MGDGVTVGNGVTVGGRVAVGDRVTMGDRVSACEASERCEKYTKAALPEDSTRTSTMASIVNKIAGETLKTLCGGGSLADTEGTGGRGRSCAGGGDKGGTTIVGGVTISAG
jgi:hypothetical protein